MKKALFAILALCLITTACTPLEKQAYKTVVAAKAFLDNEKKIHTECPAATTTVCSDLQRATAAKDLLIDAAETYCSSPAFETGGPCQPPAKGTPAYDQATAKLQAAIAGYNRTAADLKGVL